MRGVDARLVMSVRDVRGLVPAVCAWLERGVPPEQVARTLSGTLPAGDIRRPAKLVAHRLTEWLPPVLPTAPPPVPVTLARAPDPFQDCDGCGRVFRSPAPGLCRGCRTPDTGGPRPDVRVA
ncbi:hypothetical protein ABZW18_09480 [Streptomyces sp. NPDC004647]|uniref:hypothetical protein n=1 Tax=Streptomyces sp. NPDC004647 TaxID=3154671 RepID=UPI0033A1C640